MRIDYFKNIRHIPHFYMIRSVESRILSDYIEKAEGPFLDLGCGNGTFGKALELYNIYGIDIKAEAIAGIKDNGYYTKVLIATASEIPFPEGFFMTIFANCALEHMDKIDQVISEVRRVLKRDGKFIFTVPTRQFLYVIEKDKVIKGFGLNSKESIARYNEIHHHVNILDYEEWKKKIENRGFKILKYGYYLPGSIGGFVGRMDMLYTLEAPGSKETLQKIEKRYKSIRGLPFRMYFNRYIKNLYNGSKGTHLIIKAAKV